MSQTTKRILKRVSILIVLVIAGFIFYFSLGSDVTDNLDDYIYELPFKEGTGHKVVQAYGGRFSHKNIAALDFGMPVGTPVYAAREGIVYSTKDDSNQGGPFAKYGRKANYIIIKHKDGSFGCYWHLKQKGVVIKKGSVAKGQLIGYSGSTGFVLRPHLHFAVKLRLNFKKDSFVKTEFRTTKGVLLLERGEIYTRPSPALKL